MTDKAKEQQAAAPETSEKVVVAEVETGETNLFTGKTTGVNIVEKEVDKDGNPIVEKPKDEKPKEGEKPKEEKKDSGDSSKNEDGTPKEKEKEEEKPLILNRFKDLDAVKRAREGLIKEYTKVVEEVGDMEKELGLNVLGEVYESDEYAEDEKDVVVDYRKLEKAYTVATQKRSECRKKLAVHDPGDELLIKKTDTQLDKEWEDLQKKPRNEIIKIIRGELDRYVDRQRKTMEISKEEIQNENSRIKDAINTFRAAHPDYDELKDGMDEFMKNDIPVGANLPTSTLLKIAYDVVKGKKSPIEVKKQIDKAKADEAEIDKQEKISANLESGSGAGGGEKRQNNNKPTDEESLVADIVNSGSKNIFS